MVTENGPDSIQGAIREMQVRTDVSVQNTYKQITVGEDNLALKTLPSLTHVNRVVTQGRGVC